MVKPHIEKVDLVFLIRKISALHEFVDGRPLGVNQKIADFFQARLSQLSRCISFRPPPQIFLIRFSF